MHCPSCGQQQISQETKFCSKCGLPLGLVSEIVARGGYLPQLAELNKSSATIFTKKNGVMFSLFWFIFFVPFLTWIFAGVFGLEILPEILALIGVFGALMIFIFSLVYLKKTPKATYLPEYNHAAKPPGLYHPNQAALPGQHTLPASVYAPPRTGNWRDTKDLEPSSVTESTTRLLEKEERDQ